METTGERVAGTPTELAADLLVALRTDDDPESRLSALDSLSERDLTPVGEDRETALAFWLNCYNAGTAHLLAERPGLYDSRWRFFRAPALSVAGHPLSLDDIEHGLLRGSRSKYGLGYLPRLLPDSFELRYALSTVDPRLHFALHCGAASCPAIRAYDPGSVDDQLDLATRTYLDSTVEHDGGVVWIPRVFRWFPGDFGGRSGVRDFLRRYGQLPDETASLGYLDWDWSKETPTFVG